MATNGSFAMSFAMALALALTLGLGACARPVGDLGRARTNALHDDVMPVIGDGLASGRGELVSTFNLADEEREMRDRVWRFLVAAHTRDWFYDTAVELQRTRITSPTDMRFEVDRYYLHLQKTRYRSSRVRYQTIIRDIGADTATIPGTFAAICTVREMDQRRAVAVTGLHRTIPQTRIDVTARKAENDAAIGWFIRALRYRYESYSTALERLLVETPHEEARLVDARLSGLAAAVERAEAGDFCTTEDLFGARPIDMALPGRVQSSANYDPAVPK